MLTSFPVEQSIIEARKPIADHVHGLLLEAYRQVAWEIASYAKKERMIFQPMFDTMVLSTGTPAVFRFCRLVKAFDYKSKTEALNAVEKARSILIEDRQWLVDNRFQIASTGFTPTALNNKIWIKVLWIDIRLPNELLMDHLYQFQQASLSHKLFLVN